MESGGILNAASEYKDRLDGIETLIIVPAEPLDLSMSHNNTEHQPSTQDQNQSNNSKTDEASNQFQTPVRYTEKQQILTDTKTTSVPTQRQISVLRPTPIYCCRPTTPSSTNDSRCQSKASITATLNQAYCDSNTLKSSVSVSQQQNQGLHFNQGYLGIFGRKTKRELMKLGHWNSTTMLNKEAISTGNNDYTCESMKFEKKNNSRFQHQFLPDRQDTERQMAAFQEGALPSDTGERMAAGKQVCGNKAFDTCKGISIDDKSCYDQDQGTYLLKRTNAFTERNSFEALYEYLANQERQSSLDIVQDEEGKYSFSSDLPVLERCEEILEPEKWKESLYGAERIPDLVEPSVSSTLDNMVNCRFSPFSVFNQFSELSKCPEATFSLAGLDDKDENSAVFSPQVLKSIATVFPFQEYGEAVTGRSVGAEMVLPTPLTDVMDVGMETMVIDFSTTNKDHSNLLLQPAPAVETLEERYKNKQNESVSCAGKGAMSVLKENPLDEKVSLSKMESLQNSEMKSKVSRRELSLPSSKADASFERGITLPPLLKNSVLFSEPQSMMPSLHKESAFFSCREPVWPTIYRDPSSTPVQESDFSSKEKSELASSLIGTSAVLYGNEHLLHQTPSIVYPDKDSIFTVPYPDDSNQSNALKDLSSFVQKHVTKLESESSFSANTQQYNKDKNSPFEIGMVKDKKTFETALEMDTKTPSLFSEGVKESQQVINWEVTDVAPLPLTTSSSEPKVKNHPPSSLVLNKVPNYSDFTKVSSSPIYTNVPSSCVFAEVPHSSIYSNVPTLSVSTEVPNTSDLAKVPNSPVNISVPNSAFLTSNSHTFTSVSNSPILTTDSSWIPSSQIYISSQNSNPAPFVTNMTCQTTLVLNPETNVSPSLPKSPSLEFPSPPCTKEKEKVKQQGIKLSTPMKHKQMLIEKYKMSVCMEAPERSPGMESIEQHNRPLIERNCADKSEEFTVSKTDRSKRKQRLFQTDISELEKHDDDISQFENQENAIFETKIQDNALVKKKKIMKWEHFDSDSSYNTLQPEDLDPCETFYWCHVCEKSVKCEKDASRHMTGHGFNTKANLLYYYTQVYGCVTLHWRGYNRLEKCVYLCGLCDQTIPYINGFKRHIQGHGYSTSCDPRQDAESPRKHKSSKSGKRDQSLVTSQVLKNATPGTSEYNTYPIHQTH
ncbi:serine-rich adhesin for platelets-like isoform X2 [Argopecten irradians]|uniref:serine-rich adhesin for platelets-like isoform X2 n=1 Tax=Argopecten irradians TaxID=31199 RepID=UPI00371F96D6